jgi:hypothetical protein
MGYGGIENKGKEELKVIYKAMILNLRKKGYPFQKIADEIGIPMQTAYLYYREEMVVAAKRRDEDQPIFLEQTIAGFDQLEEIILARGRINLEASLRRAEMHHKESLGKAGQVAGRNTREWEIELSRLSQLSECTLGMENEDIDRLQKIRDRRASFLGVEPPQKIAVEHVIVTQANAAQSRLRMKLGIDEKVPEAEVVEPVEVGDGGVGIGESGIAEGS